MSTPSYNKHDKAFVYFDIGNTLMEGPPQSPWSSLVSKLELNSDVVEDIQSYILTHNISCMQVLVEYLSASHPHINRDLINTSVMEVWDSQIRGPSRINGSTDLLRKLNSRDIDYGFISNIWHPYAETFLLLYSNSMGHTYRPKVFSHVYGIAKPDSSLYAIALSLSGSNPENTIMVGDSYINDIFPAMKVGMKTVWVLNNPRKEKVYIDSVKNQYLLPPSLIVNSINEITPESLLELIP